MSLFDNRTEAADFLQQYFPRLSQAYLDLLTGWFPDPVEDEEEPLPETEDSFQFNDNIIGNNAAVLLSGNAQNTVNFLYVNPIEFFNNGPSSDIHLDFTLATGEGADPDEQDPAALQANGGDAVEDDPEDLGETNEFNDNVIGNNAAIILTDNAKSNINFLYINPIEFFNNGPSSDIYINFNSTGEPSPEPVGLEPISVANEIADETGSSLDTTADLAPEADWFSDPEEAAAALELAFEILDRLGAGDQSDPSDPFGLPTPFGLPSPPGLLDLFGLPDVFDFENEVADEVLDDVVDTFGDSLGDANEINDNVIGNNAAVIVTDDAQNTVNFIYINPINFFNNGGGGDIYLNFTLDENSEFFVL